MNTHRNDFPILAATMNDHPLVYLDNAATTQKPRAVIDTMNNFYATANASVARAVHTLGEQATAHYEQARAKLAQFINAQTHETIFTSGTTHGINLVAHSWALQHIKTGDEIVISELEHHANLLVWQEVAHRTGATLRYIPITHDGDLQYDILPSLLNKKTRLVAITHVSNALGTTVDIERIIKEAHAVGARVLIDAAQSAPHQKIDVKKIDCDFLVFSAHKMLGPTGIGILFSKKDLHDVMTPYMLGGGMVYHADYHSAQWAKAPHKFEAGTPAVAQAVGFAAAIDYLEKNIVWAEFKTYEAQLCAQLIDGLQRIPRITIMGPLNQLKKEGHLVSWYVDGIHAHDVAAYLSSQGICVRAGNLCAQPLAHQLKVESLVRASFYFYNTPHEVTYLLECLNALIAKGF